MGHCCSVCYSSVNARLQLWLSHDDVSLDKTLNTKYERVWLGLLILADNWHQRLNERDYRRGLQCKAALSLNLWDWKMTIKAQTHLPFTIFSRHLGIKLCWADQPKSGKQDSLPQGWHWGLGKKLWNERKQNSYYIHNEKIKSFLMQ